MLAQLVNKLRLFFTTQLCITVLTTFRHYISTIADRVLLHAEWSCGPKIGQSVYFPLKLTGLFLFPITARKIPVLSVFCSLGIGKLCMGWNRAECESAHTHSSSKQNGTSVSHRPYTYLSMARNCYLYVSGILITDFLRSICILPESCKNATVFWFKSCILSRERVSQ